MHLNQKKDAVMARDTKITRKPSCKLQMQKSMTAKNKKK
jgi:hypothetical protein